jgi:hypothetical protein
VRDSFDNLSAKSRKTTAGNSNQNSSDMASALEHYVNNVQALTTKGEARGIENLRNEF